MSHTDQLLLEMKDLITARIYAAMSNPAKPPRASMINAAVAWAKLTGTVRDAPTPRAPGSISPHLAARLPFITDEERARYRKLAEEEDQAALTQREKLAAVVEKALAANPDLANATDDDDSASDC